MLPTLWPRQMRGQVCHLYHRCPPCSIGVSYVSSFVQKRRPTSATLIPPVRLAHWKVVLTLSRWPLRPQNRRLSPRRRWTSTSRAVLWVRVILFTSWFLVGLCGCWSFHCLVASTGGATGCFPPWSRGGPPLGGSPWGGSRAHNGSRDCQGAIVALTTTQLLISRTFMGWSLDSQNTPSGQRERN
jgi:hypothetical protein